MVTAFAPSYAGAFLGDCSQPVTNNAGPVATDCLRILQVGVGSATCVPECICEPKGTAPPTATDALICLQKAVGQSIALACPCSISTTTTMTPTTTTSSSTTSTMPILTDTELIVITKTAGGYAQSDLTGTWNLQLIESGPGAPSWSRGTMTIQSNGAASANLSNLDGSVDPVSLMLTLSPAGIITCQGTECPNPFQGALDAGKTVAAITFSDTDTSTALIVLTKTVGPYAQADIAGTWGFNALESGPGAPWFGRGTLTIQSNGAFSGNITESDGAVTATSGTLGLSTSGAASCSGAGCVSQFAGALDAGKTVGASTGTDAVDGSSEMDLIVKTSSSYAQTDLAGNWQLNAVVSGLQAPLWERAALTILADGTVSVGPLVDSAGLTDNLAGLVLSLSGNGVITSPTEPDLRCALDADKTVAICTTLF